MITLPLLMTERKGIRNVDVISYFSLQLLEITVLRLVAHAPKGTKRSDFTNNARVMYEMVHFRNNSTAKIIFKVRQKFVNQKF